MFGFQSKITHHANKQEELKLNEKRQSTDANTELTKTFELSDKYFKAAITKGFNEQLGTCLKEMKK